MYIAKDDEIKKVVELTKRFEKCPEIKEILTEYMLEVAGEKSKKHLYILNNNKFMLMDKGAEMEIITTCDVLEDGSFHLEKTWQQYSQKEPRKQIGIGFHHITYTPYGIIKREEKRNKIKSSDLSAYSCYFVNDNMLYSNYSHGTYLYTGEITALCQARKVDLETFYIFLDEECYGGKRINEKFMDSIALMNLAKEQGLEPTELSQNKIYKKEDC